MARENGGGDNVFDSFLNHTAHGASAHFGVVAFVDEKLFCLSGDSDGNFLGFESFIGRSNNKI